MNILLLSTILVTSAFLPSQTPAFKSDFAGSTNTTPAIIALETVSASPFKHIPPADIRENWITAYSSSPDETDDTPFITASGKHVRDGIVASNELPFGTRIKIPSIFGNKIFTVEDRLNRRFSNHIDIWMPSKEKAKVFGIVQEKIIILEELAEK